MNRTHQKTFKCRCPPKKKALNAKCLGTLKDVSQVVEAMAYSRQPRQKCVCSSFKQIKRPRLRRRTQQNKPPCIPMSPPMATRMQYIRHCAAEAPPGASCCTYVKPEPVYDPYGLKTEKPPKPCKRASFVSCCEGGRINLEIPVRKMKHTESDTSIFNMPSPKTSTELVMAERAKTQPHLFKPPLPPGAAYDLYKPHSGILINASPDYVPEVVDIPGSRPGPRKKRATCCVKGRICFNKRCPRKKCRKHGKIMRKRLKEMGPCAGGEGPQGIGYPRDDEDDDNVCGPADLPVQELVPYPAHIQRGTLVSHSMTLVSCRKDKKAYRYGILAGSHNMYDSRYGPKSRGKQAIPMAVMAYCLAFHYHPKQWNVRLLDNLLEAGDKWYLQLLEKVHDHSAVMGICEVIQFGKKHALNLNGKKMQILLGEPDIVGYTMSNDPAIYNLCKGLKAFFKMNRAGLLLTKVYKTVLWKDKVCYYLFDPAGRDSKAYSNFTTGTAALLNLKDLECLAEVLLARTVVEDQKYLLAPLKVLKMMDEKIDEDITSDPELTQAEKAELSFRILNENCAIVNATMHLGDKSFEDAKFRQALPMAIVALSYAKISPPNTWHSKTVDKILRLGNKLFVDCAEPKVMVDVTIDNIPNEIAMGPFCCEVIIYRDRSRGQLFTQKECIFNIKTGLEDFFNHGYNSGILEFNNYAVAVWKQKDMYYYFDPYPRTADGHRTAGPGRACVFMLINPETLANVFTDNWDYLPPTTQFYVHAFKVLKLKKKEPRQKIMCQLSSERLPRRKVSRKVLRASRSRSRGGYGSRGDSKSRGDSRASLRDLMAPCDSMKAIRTKSKPLIDEEKMADITSLVDSILEDYVPKIALRYKNMQPDPMPAKMANLDSPTVSVTQVVPPWPTPRDKRGEPIDPDPEYEPTPPPTPPPPPPAEGAGEEAGEEEDEKPKEKKPLYVEPVDDIPDAMPPPPPSPQNEPDLACSPDMIDEIETLEPVKAARKVLLAADARKRFKLRQLRKKLTLPLAEAQIDYPICPEVELQKPTNFKTLPDSTQIVRGTKCVQDGKTPDVLPFASIMAIVLSYKYTISTWSTPIVTFVIDAAKNLCENKVGKFQYSFVHVIPKMHIGQQAYKANIDIVSEGSTWNLENVLRKAYLPLYDRGMVTTFNYSCAFFRRNGLFYLFDGSCCNAMGLREDDSIGKGKACLLRFRCLHDMVSRILYNKAGGAQDHQFILSRIVVRRLLTEPRMKLPDDYDYNTQSGKKKWSKAPQSKQEDEEETILDKCLSHAGYKMKDGIYTVEGTTRFTESSGSGIKACHFICLVAMLMAALHPVRTWDHVMVDTCVEKGLEIANRCPGCLQPTERRVIRNLLVDGKLVNINIRRLTVVNENADRTLDQYLKAVLARLRYVIITYPFCSMVICYSEGYYHLFDPYSEPAASWTLHTTLGKLAEKIRRIVIKPNSPDFYTFELTSIKTAPKYMQIAYKLSPAFKPHPNTTVQYTPRKPKPLMDEKLYWLSTRHVPWARMNPTNDCGIKRRTAKSMCKEWDIEYPGDLYSLWGCIHPKEYGSHPGKQYLATCVIALGMIKAVPFDAWTSSMLDGIVKAGDIYHEKSIEKLASKTNVELAPEDLDTKFEELFPYHFEFKINKVVFGFVYNILPDRFNLSKALVYFFESSNHGILVSPGRNLAFGIRNGSYYLFDCQTYGSPIFPPKQGAAYILRCMSINRLLYCMIFALNCRTHGQQFYLYKVHTTLRDITESKGRRMSSVDEGSRKSSVTDSKRSSKSSIKDVSKSGSAKSSKTNASKESSKIEGESATKASSKSESAKTASEAKTEAKSEASK